MHKETALLMMKFQKQGFPTYPLRLVYRITHGGVAGTEMEDIDFSTAQLHVRRTINRLAKYEAHDGENKKPKSYSAPQKRKTPAARFR